SGVLRAMNLEGSRPSSTLVTGRISKRFEHRCKKPPSKVVEALRSSAARKSNLVVNSLFLSSRRFSFPETNNRSECMSASSTDRGLLTPENCCVVFIDHQPQMFFGVASIDRQTLLNNVLVLAKAAKIFGVPVILTAVESTWFSGNITPQLLDLFPDHSPIERTSMNAWDSNEFLAAVRKTGRRNFLLAALWSEACLAFPAL